MCAETAQLMFRAELPWPPSVNTYWRAFAQGGRARTILSAAGRKYQTDVAIALDGAAPGLDGPPVFPAGTRVRVVLTLCPPNLRAFDIDNRPKSVFDALTKAGVWADDGQVDELLIRRAPVVKGGSALVLVTAID